MPNYLSSSILETNRFKLYWDRTVQTDRFIYHNRPDIMVYNKGRRKVTIIEEPTLSVIAPWQWSSEISGGWMELWDSSSYHLDDWSCPGEPQLEKELADIQKSVILNTCAIARESLGQDDLPDLK